MNGELNKEINGKMNQGLNGELNENLNFDFSQNIILTEEEQKNYPHLVKYLSLEPTREQLLKAINLGVIELFNVKCRSNAYSLGKRGEDYVYELLKNKYNIIDCRQNSHCGDFQLIPCSIGKIVEPILIECKNYSSSIPSREIDKFYNDLISQGAPGGIFVSLNSPITGISACIDIQYKTLNMKLIPIIFISSDNEDIIISAVNIMLHLCRGIYLCGEDSRLSEETIKDLLTVANSLSNAKQTLINLSASNTITITNLISQIAQLEGLLIRHTKQLENIEILHGLPQDIFERIVNTYNLSESRLNLLKQLLISAPQKNNWILTSNYMRDSNNQVRIYITGKKFYIKLLANIAVSCNLDVIDITEENLENCKEILQMVI
jgi:hypothetical protein